MATLLKKKWIGNDQIDGAKIKLLPGQTLRKDDGAGGSIDVLALLEAGTAQVQTNLDAETVARNAADTSLQNQINTVQTDLGTEISTRAAAIGQVYTDFNANDALLTTIINDEVARASGEEAAIRGEFAAADAGLQSQIDAISGGGTGSLSALQAELDASQSSIGLEPDGSYIAPAGTVYIASETSIKAALTALDGVMTTVEGAINVEISDRQGAIADLQDQIDNVLSNVDGSALDSLTEIVSAFQAADANLNGAITALASSASSGLASEASARQAADTALQGEIDAEETARAAADTTLQNNINSEASARSAADVVLQGNIDDLDGYAQVIRADLDQEVLDREAAVTAEASARASADTALDGRVSVLESVVWFKEKFAISNGQISVSLTHTPEANSMTAFVDRLAIHQGASEDYTISGSTMTFLNDLVSPGQSQLGSGDTVYLKYQYKV